MSEINNKNLLILGSNPETSSLVDVANRMGVNTYVMDYVKNSPAKKNAKFSIDEDPTDIKKILSNFDKMKIDGILIGVADVLLPWYELSCRLRKIPCYATPQSIKAFSSKNEFTKLCKKYGFSKIPDYKLSLLLEKNCKGIDFPIIVKPVDRGAGQGITKCYEHKDIKKAINNALKTSKSKDIVCEKFMNGDDIQVYYTFVNSQYYLSSIIDRTTNKNQGNLSPVCIGANYNSKHKNLFLKKYNQKFLSMFSDLGIENGIFSVQCFVEKDEIFPYDPGFRLQGEAQHLILKTINGFDHREMLINFALTGKMFDGNFSKVNDLHLKNKFACSVWVLLCEGTIDKIEGIQKIKKLSTVANIVQRLEIGDIVDKSMVGTEKQVFARLYLVSNTKKNLQETIGKIHRFLKITDLNKKNMIIDYFKIE